MRKDFESGMTGARTRAWPIFVALTLASVIAPRKLHAAYIDPGAGALYLQLVLSAVLGAYFSFRRQLRTFYDRLLVVLRVKKKDVNVDGGDTP